MENIVDKANSTAGANGQLPAEQYNDHKGELQKSVTKTGQALSAAITDQLSKAIFINAISAASMIDSGSGNAITLNPVTGGSGLVPPGDYGHFNGGVVCFNKADPNTGTAVTIAPWGLTAKALVRKDGSLPAIGDVIGECFVKWDNSADKWILLRNETDTYKYLVSASGAVAPKFANNEIEVDLSGGNISLDPLPVPDFIGQRIDFVGVGSGICDIASGNGVTNLGIEFGETEGVSFVSVEKSLALVWELTIDRATTCKAWVNFDGSGVISIRDSFNVSSITDVGAGNYTINYTNNMKTPDYSAVCLCSDSFSSTTNVTITSGSVFVGSINIQTRNAAGTAGDPNIVTLQVFGL